jgi:hypothetical protein
LLLAAVAGCSDMWTFGEFVRSLFF